MIYTKAAAKSSKATDIIVYPSRNPERSFPR
jgi:hypothetical protein